MRPKAEETALRIEQAVRRLDWPSAGEVAKSVNLSAGTTRTYLLQLVAIGRIVRRPAPELRNPQTGGPGSRFHVPAEPPGPAAPTAQLLCEKCAADLFGDELRYHKALTADPYEGAPEDFGDEYDQWEAAAKCQRCGQARLSSATS